MSYPTLNKEILARLNAGTVIPAHPLALNAQRQLDEERQRQLTRYYLAAGAGGVAVAVHSTQFEIRKPEINLLETVLRLASEEVDQYPGKKDFIKVAGIVGPTKQAVEEANLAVKYGYHLGLLSNGGLPTLSEDELIERAQAVAQIIPLFGFYLQPAAGGRLLSYNFWKKFAAIPNVCAIKVAAFNRYQTLDVVRAVCDSGRGDQVALYTGNDDNIVADLLTPFELVSNGKRVQKRFIGGLLGHWAVWTAKAVELLEKIKSDKFSTEELLGIGVKITDMNAAIFDPSHHFHGCIPGIHEILRRQGLLEGRWCLNPDEELSPGQMEEIDRVCQQYPDLVDDRFVQEFLEQNTVGHAKG
jgi:dihydrodipicolinate synthase/N-acetylneuraminate lyase